MTRAAFVLLSVLGLVVAGCTRDAAPEPAAQALDRATLHLPAIDAAAPVDYPGIHNVVAFAPGVFSGSMPEKPDGLRSLHRLGIKTVLSVDGAQPDVEGARALGMRYVHLPIGYNGIERDHAKRIARAVRDLPHPIYIHCHHGKHRSACAAGTAGVMLGLTSPEAARERMKVSGTSPKYTGLFKTVLEAEPASRAQIDAASAEFPERWRTSSLVQAMVDIDFALEHLREIQKAGWRTPADHPDLVPAAEAGRMADLFRTLAQNPRHKAFADGLNESAVLAASIEDRLIRAAFDAQSLSADLNLLIKACADCHVAHRD
jgi:protein tyrosine phosphatase (PTP) superfamily phosphohydrolase (DUF442 family)